MHKFTGGGPRAQGCQEVLSKGGVQQQYVITGSQIRKKKRTVKEQSLQQKATDT